MTRKVIHEHVIDGELRIEDTFGKGYLEFYEYEPGHKDGFSYMIESDYDSEGWWYMWIWIDEEIDGESFGWWMI